MKSFLLLIATLCCCSLLANGTSLRKGIKGSRTIQTEERTAGNFTAISASRSIHVFLAQGETSAITVKADDNLLPYLKTEIKGDQLKIYISEDIEIKSYEKMEVYVTAPQIKEIRVTTSASLETTTPWKVKELKINSTTSADVRMNIDAQAVNVSATTSSEVDLKGKAYSLDASITTSAEVDAPDLTVEHATMKITTSGEAKINVISQLTYSVTTGGDLTYSGNPELIKPRTSSGGSVSKK